MKNNEKTTKPVMFDFSPLQSALNEAVPFWFKDRCPLLWACLYWNGFPTHWSLDDLINPDNHHAKTPKEANKLLGLVQRILKMLQAASDHAKNGTLKHRKMEDWYVTPYEFARFCIARRWMPIVRVFRELNKAPSTIAEAARELFEERAAPPALASQVIKKKTNSLKMLHREQCILTQVASRSCLSIRLGAN